VTATAATAGGARSGRAIPPLLERIRATRPLGGPAVEGTGPSQPEKSAGRGFAPRAVF